MFSKRQNDSIAVSCFPRGKRKVIDIKIGEILRSRRKRPMAEIHTDLTSGIVPWISQGFRNLGRKLIKRNIEMIFFVIPFALPRKDAGGGQWISRQYKEECLGFLEHWVTSYGERASFILWL